MSAKEIVIIGGGEHARVVLSTLRMLPDKWTPLGFLDPLPGEKMKETALPCLGCDTKIPELLAGTDASFILALGTSKIKVRRKIVSDSGIPDSRWATIIHPSALISEKAQVAHGSVVLARSVLQNDARIGRHCIVNTGAILEHDVKIADFTHVAPGVIAGGGVEIGSNCFIGLGSRIRDHICIGDDVTVGTGSVVVTDIPSGETVVGVPARRISYDRSSLDIGELCVSPSTTIYEALSTIGKYGTMLALVTDERRVLLGVLSDGDVRRALIKRNDLNCPVEKIMTRNFSFVRPDVSRAAALDKMKSMVIRQLPVLDEEGRVVGLHMLSELLGSVSLPNIAVIMAGGKGERLRPITENLPKPMVKVAGRPILEHIIHHLVSSNIRDIFIAVNYLGEMIEDCFKDGSAYGCRIRYLKEESPLGTAGALSLLPELPANPVILMNGDLVTQVDIERMLHHHQQGAYKITVGVNDYRVRIPYGVLEMDKDQDRICEIREKPEQRYLVNAGIYAIEPSVLERIGKNRCTLMTEIISDCISRGERLGIHLVEGDWLDIGQHSQLAQARGIA